jgi:Icc protein
MTVHVLHLSDLHLNASPGAPAYGHDPDAQLDAVLAAAAARQARFDLVAVTGDIADDGSAAAYRRARQRLRALGTLRWVPGNHDDPDRMRQVEPEAFAAHAAGSWRLVPVNSRWPHRTPGQVTAEQLAQLDTALRAPGPPHQAVLIHHPPRPPCTHGDCQIRDAAALLEVLDRHPRLRLVLSGHMHRSFCHQRANVTWLGAPSVCMQVTHPDHAHTDEPPAANLLELHDDGSMTMTALHARPARPKTAPAGWSQPHC